MKKLFIAALLLATCPLFGQVTTGFHRFAQVLGRAPGSAAVNVQPYAQVYVTSTATGMVGTIYSDPGLSISIPSGMVTADANGNYNYYIALNYCVSERISYPGAGNINIPNICSLGASAPVALTTGYYPVAKSSTSIGNGTIDYGITTAGVNTSSVPFTANDAITGINSLENGSGGVSSIQTSEGSDSNIFPPLAFDAICSNPTLIGNECQSWLGWSGASPDYIANYVNIGFHLVSDGSTSNWGFLDINTPGTHPITWTHTSVTLNSPISLPLLTITGTQFTVTGCGTATSLIGGSIAGKFVAGSASCTPVITTNQTAPNGYSCEMNDQTTASVKFQETAYTTTTVTFTATGTLGSTDTINFGCFAF